MDQLLKHIGEEELLNRLKRFVPLGQIDDDTAEINTRSHELLVNTDVVVEGVHFNEKTCSPKDLGWKSIAINLSDLACSGVDQILGVTVGLIAPPDTPWNWVEGVYEGMAEALKKFNGKLIGGDCSKGQEKILAITVIGTLGPLRLHRSHAQPGDQILVSGSHGLSRLGLALLLSEPIPNYKFLTEHLKSQAILAHQRPIPPLKALTKLIQCKPRQLPWRAAGTDSSDGLLAALQGLCKSSNCQAILNKESLPKHKEWPSSAHWDNWCLNGGEDYQLVLSLPPLWAQAWMEEWPGSKAIGFIQNGPPEVSWENGAKIKEGNEEFEHFSEQI